MIRLNELRIGNLVHKMRAFEKKYDLVTIENIAFGRINVDRVEKNYNPYTGTGFPSGIDLNIIDPIPLTEEWFKKLGFMNFNGDFWVNGPVFISIKNDGFFFYFQIVNGGNIEIKYVHQLQNLYFALAGEELVTNDITNNNPGDANDNDLERPATSL